MNSTAGLIILTSATDLSGSANLERGLDFLLLGLLATMTFYGFCALRCRSGYSPRVFCWSSLVALVTHGGALGAAAWQEGLRNMDPPAETPDLPITFETWSLLASVGGLLLGIALMVAGVSFVYHGWLEGKMPGGRRKKRARG